MAHATPRGISDAERRGRRIRATQIARSFGFVGRIDYRHVYGQTGGAQYGIAELPEQDILIVHAEAFDRDADPDDFSLDAIIAHERGHQLLVRHPRISRVIGDRISEASEEILASVVGALLCENDVDRTALISKATAELLDNGVSFEVAVHRVKDLLDLFDRLL